MGQRCKKGVNERCQGQQVGHGLADVDHIDAKCDLQRCQADCNFTFDRWGEGGLS